jgi:uncharacterized protein
MHDTRIAVVGSGIAGLAAAYKLHKHAHITLFEANDYAGGHTNTVDVTLDKQSFGVDTGFLVYNERTYPKLIALLQELKVPTVKSDMSFSVKHPDTGLEWNGANLNTVFAQRRNLFRPRFHRMLGEVLRFNRTAQSLADAKLFNTTFTIGDFLEHEGFSEDFRNWYFLPMIGCIWSCPTAQMLQFPLSTMLSFCSNHGLLQVNERPQWYTVKNGAREYVKRIISLLPDVRLNTPVTHIRRDTLLGKVYVTTAQGTQAFDQIIIATHSDQALAILDNPLPLEREVLGAIRYQPNLAVLHTDTTVLPRKRRAWAAWNYEHGGTHEQAKVCLHYLLNKLQPLPTKQPVIVSLNPVKPIEPSKIIRQFSYSHPVFDSPAIRAQRDLRLIQGVQNTWFCGAWVGFGFHEDGLKAGLAVAEHIIAALAHAKAPVHERPASTPTQAANTQDLASQDMALQA